MTTIKPATPLPWYKESPMQGIRAVSPYGRLYMAHQSPDHKVREQDAAYIVAACNAYPRLIAEREELIAALREIVSKAQPQTVSMGKPFTDPFSISYPREISAAIALLARLGEV